MTPKEFVDSHLGKAYDVDKQFQYQCWDLWAEFWNWAGLDPNKANRNTVAKQYGGTGYAMDIWNYRVSHNLALYFDFIVGYKNFQDGDWIVWPECTYAPLSHIAMYYQGQSFGQRQHGHSEATLQNASFDQAYGALRMKGWNKEVSEKGNDLEQLNASGTAASTRKISTAFIIYAKTGTTPKITKKDYEFSTATIHALQIVLDDNTQACVSYCPETEWLCKMQSSWMLENGWYEIAAINGGYFEMSGNVGKPVGAVMVDWAGAWSTWNGTECVPAKDNGYPTLGWTDGAMELLNENADSIYLKKYHWLIGTGQSLVIDHKVNCNVGYQNGRYDTKNNASAIGYDSKTKTLTLFINSGGTLNTLERAYVAQGLGCELAVQLDGGGSTQIEWLASVLSESTVTPEPTVPTEPETESDTVKELKEKISKALVALNDAVSALK